MTNRIIFSIVLGGCLTVAGNAAVFVVNSSADDQSDGCGIAPNGCTLREAVNAANAVNDADTITIQSGITTITLLTGEFAVNTGAVSITPAATNILVTINGGMNGRIFNVSADTTLNRLLLTGGNSAANGGAINNNGAVLTINDSFITGSTATGNGGGINTVGGTVNLNRSTVGGIGANGNSAANGGGIYNQNGAVNLTNSTISGNMSGNIGGGYYGFAGVSVPPTTSIISSLNSTSSTIAFNSAINGGGIAVSSTTGFTSTATINNTIAAKNTAVVGPDLSDNPPLALGLPGTITSGGYNLIGNTSGAAIVSPPLTTGDQIGTGANPIDPLLLPLAANDGLTPTHALQLSPIFSPAIDKGNTAQPVDQRGFTRNDDFPTVTNAGNATDIGAFEAQIGATASEVTVGGRVRTANGRNVSRAVVTIINSSGAARQAMTNPFGFYRFTNVPSGAVYILEVRAKGHTFAPQVISVSDELSDVNFTANP